MRQRYKIQTSDIFCMQYNTTWDNDYSLSRLKTRQRADPRGCTTLINT